MSRQLDEFRLQFDPKLITKLSVRYRYVLGDAPFEAGRRIAAGEYSRENLRTIVYWKSPRSTPKVDRNTSEEVARALSIAVQPRGDRCAVSALVKLYGVGIPVASAILTTLDPSRYTIVDVRALEALGIRRSSLDIDFYLAYLQYCRMLAADNGIDLRTLDRALWQWSSEQAGSIAARASGSPNLTNSAGRRATRGSVKEKILELRREAMPVAQIARTLGKPYSHVYTTVKNAGLL